MTEQQYERIGHVFDRLRVLFGRERAAALGALGEEDVELRAEVVRLLEADRQADSRQFLERPVLHDAAEAFRVSGFDSPLPAAGTLLGNYRLGKRIGAGGMGVVYEAEDLALDRRVALKVLPVDGSPHFEERVARFQREARAAGQLNHPHIAVVHDAGFAAGCHYIAMEFVEGRTLRQIIAGEITAKKAESLDTRTIFSVVAQVASALSSAHAAGIVHRDIKPENIMVRPDGFVKVLDFGLASVGEPGGIGRGVALDTRSGHIAGTLQYLSPEQVLGKAATPQSDLFSLGIIAYELATGLRPFEGATDGAVFDAIVHRDPAPPSLIRPSVGREFDDFVQHALEKDPELRFQTAGDFRSTCLRLSKHSSLSATVPAASLLRAPAKRSRRTAIAAYAALSLVFAAIAVWWVSRPAPMPRVARIVQITRSDAPVSYFVNDGARIYFAAGPQNQDLRIFQVSTAGGEPVAVPQLSGMFPLDISRDGSQLLLAQPTAYIRVGPFPLWVAAVVGATPRKLGDLAGQFGRWSPQGDRILYSGQGTLKIANADGSGARDVVHVPGYIEDGVWSPDGRRIRFTVSLPNSRRIWEIGVDGSGLHPIFPGWKQPWLEMGTWMPGGKYFLFSAGQSAHDLWISREGDRPVRFTNGPLWDFRPQPSADGRRVYFVGTSNFGQLVRFDLQSKQWLPFLGGIDAVQVDFSRDGKRIVYADSNGCLWRSAADGSQRIQLTAPPLFARNPRWSPSGDQIVFHAAPAGQPDAIYILPANGGILTQLTHAEGGFTSAGDGSWSPDASSVLYCALSDEKDRKPYLFKMDLRTRVAGQLPNTGGLWSPRWSPDGRYAAALDENARLRLYDMETHRSAQLTAFAIGYPAWSRDGRYIYFENNSSTGWFRIRVGQRKIEFLESLTGLKTAPNGSGWVGAAPDGTVISARTVNSSNIYALEWDR